MEINMREYSKLELGNPNQYIRASMLSTFSFCPLCFKKTIVEDHEREEAEEMKEGTLYHTAMHLYFNGTLNFNTLEEPILGWVHWTIEQEKQRKVEPDYKPPRFLEAHFKSTELLLETHIDRVDEISENEEGKKTFAIVEYKTGRSEIIEPILLQLAFQGIVFEAVTGSVVEQLVILNPRQQFVEPFDFTIGLVKKVAYKVAKIRHALEVDDFPAKCTVGKWLRCSLCKPDEVLYSVEEVEKVTGGK